MRRPSSTRNRITGPVPPTLALPEPRGELERSKDREGEHGEDVQDHRERRGDETRVRFRDLGVPDDASESRRSGDGRDQGQTQQPGDDETVGA